MGSSGQPIAMKVLLITCLLASALAHVDYTGHQLIRTRPGTAEQAEALQELQQEVGVDFWLEPVLGRAVDIRVAPEQADDLHRFFNHSGLRVEVLSNNIQQLLDSVPMVKGSARSGHSMDWTAYHPIEDIYSYWDYLEATYDWISTETIGQSYEGTDMRLLKVCRDSAGCGTKPAMWFDGGIHAREWVSPAVATYMAMELVENDDAHPDLTKELDWYIVPVMNPDGYLYTQTNDRMWRKTRSPNTGSCFGTDANRNWGFHWNTGGSSSNPCADTYMGSEAFSEVENRNVRDFLLANKEQIKFYNNLHSYSQLILLPWGWGYDLPDNIDDLTRMANLGHDALKAVHNKEYEVGCIPCMLYPASGGTLDWTLGEAGIPYSFAMELRDTGNYGFILPPEQIIPTGEEVWAFHLTVAREIIQEFVPQKL